MTLRVDNGIPIWIPPSQQPNTNLLPDTPVDANVKFSFEKLTFAKPPISLKVPMFWQKKKNWCWAACIQMIMAYFEIEFDQCEVARVFFPTRDCCGKPNSCNEGCDPDDVTEILRSDPLQVKCTRYDEDVSYEVIKSEIDEARPVAAAIMWYTHDGDQRGGHLILIKGWRLLHERWYVKVNDPWYGPGDVPYSKLRKYYGPDDDAQDGVWEHTWTNIRRN